MGLARVMGAIAALLHIGRPAKQPPKPTKRTIELLMPTSSKASVARGRGRRSSSWRFAIEHPLITLRKRYNVEQSARMALKLAPHAWASWRKRTVAKREAVIAAFIARGGRRIAQ